MSLQVENLEHNMAKVTIEVEAAKLDDAIKQAFNKKKGQFNVPGFRKGKVPFQLIAKEYGVEIFYEDAANILIPDAYAEAMKDTDLEIVSRPEIDVTQLEKGKDFIFTATFALKPEVTLGDYKGIEVPKTRVTVKKDEIEEELKKVIACGCDIIGINNRNLKTFDVDLNTTSKLAPLIPYEAVLVSESGMKDENDMKNVKEQGADAVLIGETFMRSDNIKETMEQLRSCL